MTREELLNQANAVLSDTIMTHRNLGDLHIIKVESITDHLDMHEALINVEVISTGATKVLSLSALVKNGIAKFTSKDAEKYFTKTFQDEFDDILDQEDAEYSAMYKANQEAAKIAAAEAKYKAKVDAALKKLNNVEKANIKLSYKNIDEFYMALGWMTKHAGTISAAMPDYAEKWFISKFGDVHRYVVDSKKKTVNGNPVQWALSMKVTFKDVTEVPSYLVGKINSKNEINSVEFVWDLVDTYGFKFGRSQDVEAIRANIPVEKLSSFEVGFNS